MSDHSWQNKEWEPNFRNRSRSTRNERPPKEHQAFHVGQAAKGINDGLRHVQTLLRHYDDGEEPNFSKETLFAIQTNLVQSMALMTEVQQGVG